MAIYGLACNPMATVPSDVPRWAVAVVLLMLQLVLAGWWLAFLSPNPARRTPCED
jgi:hypothetical protein